MINSLYSGLVASCTAIEMQQATDSQFQAMNIATNNATNSLKALAGAVLQRNTQRNKNALDSQKPTQLITPKNTQLVAQNQSVNLPLDAQQSILSWFFHIGEDDQPIIEETLEGCRRDSEKLAYFLKRAQEVPLQQEQQIKCRDCLHFKCFNANGDGSGTCSAGVMAFGVCHWANIYHKCGKYQLLEVNK